MQPLNLLAVVRAVRPLTWLLIANSVNLLLAISSVTNLWGGALNTPAGIVARAAAMSGVLAAAVFNAVAGSPRPLGRGGIGAASRVSVGSGCSP